MAEPSAKLLTDEHILKLSERIRCQSELLNLGVRTLKLPERIVQTALTNKNEIQSAANDVLQTWFKKQKNGAEAFSNIQNALEESGLNLLAMELRNWVENTADSQVISETSMLILFLGNSIKFHLDLNSICSYHNLVSTSTSEQKLILYSSLEQG